LITQDREYSTVHSFKCFGNNNNLSYLKITFPGFLIDYGRKKREAMR
jgi:hypothetical protein